MRCLSCKYDLRNLTENRCPECGRIFDPDDPRTFRDTSRKHRRWWIVELVIFSAVFYLIIVTLIVADEYGRRHWLRPTFSPILLRAIVVFPFAVPFGLLIYLLWRSVISWAILSLRRTRTR